MKAYIRTSADEKAYEEAQKIAQEQNKSCTEIIGCNFEVNAYFGATCKGDCAAALRKYKSKRGVQGGGQMIMYLYCLKCKTKYHIPHWAMKHMTYREYSYCNKCHKEIEGKPRRLFARVFTRRTSPK